MNRRMKNPYAGVLCPRRKKKNRRVNDELKDTHQFYITNYRELASLWNELLIDLDRNHAINLEYRCPKNDF